MPEIFLSYKQADTCADKVEHVAAGLTESGFSLLRDVQLLAANESNWARRVDQAVVDCDYGVVLWSLLASQSTAVMGEALKLKRMNKLVCVCLEDPLRSVPADFFAAQRYELDAWNGDRRDAKWLAFVDALRKLVYNNLDFAAARKRSPAGQRLLLPDQRIELTPAERIERLGDLPPLVEVPAPGAFHLGAARGDADALSNEYEGPDVVIPRAFRIGAFPITVLEWNYAARSGAKGVTLKVMPDDRANTPVVNVSWLEAQAYLAWLNYRAESPARFRLPTEAEWEYVAKCARVSTLSAPSGGAPPVGGVAESSWGVFDLPGAVLEWVEDVYADSHAGASPIGEARTQPVSETRVVRGRSWRDGASAKGVTARGAFHERYAADDIGFRIVRELP